MSPPSQSIDDTLDRPISSLVSLRIHFHPALLPLSRDNMLKGCMKGKPKAPFALTYAVEE